MISKSVQRAIDALKTTDLSLLPWLQNLLADYKEKQKLDSEIHHIPCGQ